MEIYAASIFGDHDLPISALFWGAVIFVAVVAAWILVERAIAKLLKQKTLDGGAVEGGHTKGSQFDQTMAEIWNSEDRTEHGTRKQHD